MDLSTVPSKGPVVDTNECVSLPAALVTGGSYCGIKIRFAPTLQPAPIPVLWPPDAVLPAGLLKSPGGSWWSILLAVRLGLPTSAIGNCIVQIAPDVIGKVFDSFFTTRTHGLGVGEHGGRIAAANGREGGAVFRITLPRAGGLS